MSLQVMPSPSDDVYWALGQALKSSIPPERLITDPLRLLAYGTDASLYRLIPKIVVKAESEQEVQGVLPSAAPSRAGDLPGGGHQPVRPGHHRLGAAGPGRRLDRHRIEDNGAHDSPAAGGHRGPCQPPPGPAARKIGPDPASIDTCKIGGIAANNASGMCCGTHETATRRVESMRIILADGTLSTPAIRPAAPPSAEPWRSVGQLGRAGRRAAGQPAAGRARAPEIPHQEHHRLQPECPGRFRRSDRYPAAPADRFGRDPGLHLRDRLSHRRRSAAKGQRTGLFPDIGEACRAVPLLKKTPVAAVEMLDTRRPCGRSRTSPACRPRISARPTGRPPC